MRSQPATLFDSRPIGTKQVAIVAGVLTALVIDGLDIQLLALVTPLLLIEWGTTRAAFGPALSAALIGMALGAGIGGALGDRFGRKTMLVAAAILFGLATAAAALADGVWSLAALRLVSGIGFGAAAPNGAALASEWLPVRARPKMMALLSISIPLGGTVGASAVLWLLPHYGWRGCFVACGILTLLVALALLAKLPESPGFLLRIGRRAQAERLVERIIARNAALPSEAELAAVVEQEPSRVFTRANLRLNIGAWSTFFSLQFIAYAIIAWTPVLLTGSGWTLPQAIRGTAFFNGSAIVASLSMGMLLGRVNARALLLGAYALTLASIALVASTLALHPGAPTPDTERTVLAGIVGIGLFGGAGITAIYAMLSLAYPVSCRSGGIGMGLMMGRAGGITTTLVGGWLLTLGGDSPLPFFASLVVAIGIATLGTLILGRILPDSFSRTTA